MSLHRTTAYDSSLNRQPIDYAGAGLQWSSGFNCYVRQLGGGDYWFCAYPRQGCDSAAEVFLTCDEDVLMHAILQGHACLTRAIAKARRIISKRNELAECEDMDALTEALGMGRMFGTVAFA